MNNYIPDKDLEFQVWVDNFLAIAGDNLPALGLLPADIAALGTGSASFQGSLGHVVAVRGEYQGAVAEKESLRKTTEQNARALVKRIQANAAVSDALKAKLCITVKSAVVNHSPPVTPTLLVVVPRGGGANTLKWHKMGNKQNTQFIVLARPLTNGTNDGSDTGWAIVGQTTKARFQHQSLTPGAPMAYKIVAARADISSLPSLPVTVYAG